MARRTCSSTARRRRSRCCSSHTARCSAVAHGPGFPHLGHRYSEASGGCCLTAAPQLAQARFRWTMDIRGLPSSPRSFWLVSRIGRGERRADRDAGDRSRVSAHEPEKDGGTGSAEANPCYLFSSPLTGSCPVWSMRRSRTIRRRSRGDPSAATGGNPDRPGGIASRRRAPARRAPRARERRGESWSDRRRAVREPGPGRPRRCPTRPPGGGGEALAGFQDGESKRREPRCRQGGR
jgi:hypothetical protein